MNVQRKQNYSASEERKEEHGPQQHAGLDEDPCRCKQVAVMTPRQLLGTMLKDLAFWKRTKRKP